MVFNWGPCGTRARDLEWSETSSISDEDLESVYGFHETAGRFGAVRLALDYLSQSERRWVPGVPITLLDIRCGRGDLSRSIVRWARRRKIEIHILAVDRYGRVIQMARDRSSGYPEITFEVRDVTDPLFLQAQQFDYVISDLTIHHEDREAIVSFLKTANRLAKRGLMVTDWLRDLRAWLLVRWLARFWKNDLVADDALLAVRRGLTIREARELAAKAGIDLCRVYQHMGIRFSMSADRALAVAAELKPAPGLVGT